MAVQRNNASGKLLLKVATGTDKKGATVYSERSFAHLNPVLSDTDALEIGQKLGALQSHDVAAVSRQDNAQLVEA